MTIIGRQDPGQPLELEVGTAYLRAGYLQEPASSEIRDLLRAYAPLRIVTNDRADFQQKMARSVEIQAKLWSITEDLARATSDSDVLGLFIASLNETIDLHETRVTAGLYARVPEANIIEKGLLRPVGRPGRRNMNHDTHPCDTVFPYSLSLDCRILKNSVCDADQYQSLPASASHSHSIVPGGLPVMS